MNFCTDCRHAVRTPLNPALCCGHNPPDPEPVYGGVRLRSAAICRDVAHLCGPAGRHFEPRPPKPSIINFFRRLL